MTAQPIKTLSIEDRHTRECLHDIVVFIIAGLHLLDQVAIMALEADIPNAGGQTKEPELVSKAMT